jgi:hypothetical protein
MSKDSDHYEQVTRAILEDLREHLGLTRVMPKGTFDGASGTEWQIDASSYRAKTGALVLVECRRKTTSRIKQEEVAGFAYRIRDIGAGEGLMVTPIGYQTGAQLVASAEKIGTATLNADATATDYLITIGERLFRGLSAQDSGVGADRVAFIERRCGTCGEQLEPRGDGQFACPRCKT